jgi:hypothetical protein
LMSPPLTDAQGAHARATRTATSSGSCPCHNDVRGHSWHLLACHRHQEQGRRQRAPPGPQRPCRSSSSHPDRRTSSEARLPSGMSYMKNVLRRNAGGGLCVRVAETRLPGPVRIPGPGRRTGQCPRPAEPLPGHTLLGSTSCSELGTTSMRQIWASQNDARCTGRYGIRRTRATRCHRHEGKCFAASQRQMSEITSTASAGLQR